MGEAGAEAGGTNATRLARTSRRSAWTLYGFWYAFGGYDAYHLWEAPDDVSMAAVAMAIPGGGAIGRFETIILLPVEETMDAMQRA